MRFDLIDSVVEQSDDRIVIVKHLTNSEDYLQDHFASFPVMPGVLMLETMVQAARRLLVARDPACFRHVLGSVKALKYGDMVQPGDSLLVEVSLHKDEGNGEWTFKGTGSVVAPGHTGGAGDEGPNAVSGRFTLRPVRPTPV
jgi:3-hydroxyacyl-[acyl-carrier-protein] dehydratase